MAKIKIALCITELDIGGAERRLTELALRVDRQRFEPVVYCLGPQPERNKPSCLDDLESGNIEVHCLGGSQIWQFPIILGRLRRLLKAQRPHILQSFLFHANILGRIAARRAGVEVVVSGIRVAERRSRWHLWLDRLTEGWVDRYVCVSQSVADFSSSEGGIPPEKIVVIPNGIDVDAYPAKTRVDPMSLGVAMGRRFVVFVGRLEPQKGVAWLVQTAPEWLEKLPDCELVLVGEGPLRRELEIACRDSGIDDRVHFAGWRADVPEILAGSDLLVLPSIWEGMPNVLLEAMASRLPVVACRAEGVEELLGPGAAFQTVPYGNTELLVEKIVSILTDSQKAASLGQENRRRATEFFPISRSISAYERLWESLVAG